MAECLLEAAATATSLGSLRGSVKGVGGGGGGGSRGRGDRGPDGH